MKWNNDQGGDLSALERGDWTALANGGNADRGMRYAEGGAVSRNSPSPWEAMRDQADQDSGQCARSFCYADGGMIPGTEQTLGKGGTVHSGRSEEESRQEPEGREENREERLTEIPRRAEDSNRFAAPMFRESGTRAHSEEEIDSLENPDSPFFQEIFNRPRGISVDPKNLIPLEEIKKIMEIQKEKKEKTDNLLKILHQTSKQSPNRQNIEDQLLELSKTHNQIPKLLEDWYQTNSMRKKINEGEDFDELIKKTSPEFKQNVQFITSKEFDRNFPRTNNHIGGIAQIKGRKGNGTGFLCGVSKQDPEVAYFATNHHVVNNNPNLMLKTKRNNGTIKTGIVRHVRLPSGDKDRVMLRVQANSPFDQTKMMPAVSEEFSKNIPLNGISGTVYGHPNGVKDARKTRGVFFKGDHPATKTNLFKEKVPSSELLKDSYLSSVSIAPGSSGGPVMNQNGEVFGIAKTNRFAGERRLVQKFPVVLQSEHGGKIHMAQKEEGLDYGPSERQLTLADPFDSEYVERATNDLEKSNNKFFNRPSNLIQERKF